MRFLMLLLFLSSYFWGCSQDSLQVLRQNTMVSLTNAIINNDSATIYSFVDTSFDKEGLDFDLSFLHRKLLKYKPIITKADFKLSPGRSDNYYISILVQKDNIDCIKINFHFSPNISDRVMTLNKDVTNITEDVLKRPGE